MKYVADPDLYMEHFLPEDFYTRIAAGEGNRKLFPSFRDRAAWESLRSNLFAAKWIPDILQAAGNAASPEQLPFSLFREFAVNGNRVRYETPYFARRTELNTLVLAMCIEGALPQYMERILDYLTAILEETTWTIPAHCTWNGKKLDPRYPTDLFCAETCAQLAVIQSIIGSELEEEIPGISDRIRREVLKRGVYNPLQKDEDLFRKHWWFSQKTGLNNWTPWCGFNLILSAILLEDDPAKCADVIRQYLRPVSRFTAACPEDGFCDEGPGYFFHAGGMLLHLVRTLDKLLPGSMETFKQAPKHQAIFHFLPGAVIGDDLVNFSDCRHNKAFGNGAEFYFPAARWLQSPVLQNMAETVQTWSCDISMYKCCVSLFDAPDTAPRPAADLPPESLYPDKLAVLRSPVFSVSLKAGHNAESHNHNDLGHFCLYCGNTPVIADAGTARYAKINFSPQRYTLWYTRGSGHNAPVIGGVEQMPGEDYSAKLQEIRTGNGRKTMVCDLSNAYPDAAGVCRFLRTVEFTEDSVSVADDMTLARPAEKMLNLLVENPVQEIDAHTLKIGEITLVLENISFEKQECAGSEVLWGPLNRIILKTAQNAYKLTFQA